MGAAAIHPALLDRCGDIGRCPASTLKCENCIGAGNKDELRSGRSASKLLKRGAFSAREETGISKHSREETGMGSQCAAAGEESGKESVRSSASAAFAQGKGLADPIELKEDWLELKEEAKRNRRVHDALSRGAMKGEVEHVARALAMGAEVNDKNARGLTPMMLAAGSDGKDTVEVLEDLLAKAADPNLTDNQGWHPIHHAALRGRLDVCNFLQKHNCDPNVCTARGRTCLMLASMEGQLDIIEAFTKHRSTRAQCLGKDENNATALHFAAREGHVNIVRTLIESKAKVGGKDSDGKTPLMIACEQGKLECVKLLCKKSADVGAFCKNKRTPLMYACLNVYEGVALFLLVKRNADPYIPDMDHETPLNVAETLGLVSFKAAVRHKEALHREQEAEQA